jgi:phage tail sheath gpL-like
MADPISFNYIPGSGLTAPIFSFEVNSGGQYQQLDRFVLFGHCLSGAALAVNTPTPVADQNTVDSLCGGGSMLREMFRIAFANAPAAPFWIVNVAPAGTAPAWTLSVGSLPGIGVGTLQICGETIQINIGATDTPSTVAAAINAAINGYYNQLTDAMLPVTSTVSAAVVTATAVHPGAIMNEVNFFVPTNISNNLFASAGVLTIARTVTGSGTPTVAAALAALNDDPADYVVAPWSDSTSLAAYTAWASDTNGRWAWNRQSYGHCWTAEAGNFSGLTTLGLTLNDRHTTLIGKIAGVAAAGSITLAGQPTSGQTLTIGGTAVTAETSGATGLQFNIGGTDILTTAALLAFLQGSADPNLSLCNYAAVGTLGISITSKLDGQIGNAITLATTFANTTVSGATLTGGLNGSPHPSWLWDAGFAARVQPWLSDTTTGGVSRNQTGLVVNGLAPPRDRILWQQYNARNALNNSGVSTWSVGPAQTVNIEKIITTYRTGSAGQPDTVFRDVQSMYQTSGALKFFRAQVGVEQGNKALADSNPGNLGAITTPADIKASFVNAYGALAARGVLADADYFAQAINVQINPQNPDRVDVFAPLERVNPLDILACNATIYQVYPGAATGAAAAGT